jgi:hypothetical protein
MGSAAASVTTPHAVFEHRDYRLYQAARLLLTLGVHMQGVVVAWHVYGLTGRAMDLGYVGLAQFLPSVLLALVTGDTADRYDRRRILLACYGTTALCALLLFFLTRAGVSRVWPLYAVLALLGTARAFAGPAGQSLVPHLVPARHFPSAVAWNSSIFQVGTIAGPALGGLAYGALGAEGVYALCAALMLGATGMLAAMEVRTGRMERGGPSWQRLLAGMRFVWRQKVVLGAISLDLFAMLLGGAVALLPVYTQEILHTGPVGLGLLRSAPAVGAAAAALTLAHVSLQRHTGRVMLGCVALFGVCTVVFGLSTHLGLSLGALVVLGAADMVSTVLRQTMVALATPPEMRGRVGAVNMLFVNASNELGEFESGVTAQWLGAVRAVVLGGVGTLAVVALWAWRFPALRDVERADAVAPPRP